MYVSNVRVYPDITGFPVMEVAPVNLACTFWPILKVQFEQLASLDGAEKLRGMTSNSLNQWYEAVQQVSPRLSWRDSPLAAPVLTGVAAHWLTAITGPEAECIATSFGTAFRLPLAEEWRATAKYLAEEPFEPDCLHHALRDFNWHPAAAQFLNQCADASLGKCWGEATRLGNGLAEIVSTNSGIFQSPGHAAIGRVQGTTWSAHTEIPIPQKSRDTRFGVRPFRSLQLVSS